MSRKAIQFHLTKAIYKALLGQYAWATKIVYKKRTPVFVNLHLEQMLKNGKVKSWHNTYHQLRITVDSPYKLLSEEEVLTLILLASAKDLELLQRTATHMYKQMEQGSNAISNS